MKNLTVLLISSILTLGMLSVNAESTDGWSNGHFFVGGAAGYNRPNNISYNGNATDLNTAQIAGEVNGKINASKLSNIIGKVYGGFVWKFDQYELAIDGYIQGNTENKQRFNNAYLNTTLDVVTSINGEVKQKTIGYGIEIKPAYNFTKKIKVAVVLGYGWSPYSITATTGIQNSLNPTEGLKYGESKDFNGGHIISGVELGYQLKENLSLNITYEHDFYSNEKLSFKKNFQPEPGANIQLSANVDGLKNSNAIYAGIRYQF